ncbi:hypothetical protein CYMTET_52210, partial [Cymbomonas tetramitiformis]
MLEAWTAAKESSNLLLWQERYAYRDYNCSEEDLQKMRDVEKSMKLTENVTLTDETAWRNFLLQQYGEFETTELEAACSDHLTAHLTSGVHLDMVPWEGEYAFEASASCCSFTSLEITPHGGQNAQLKVRAAFEGSKCRQLHNKRQTAFANVTDCESKLSLEFWMNGERISLRKSWNSGEQSTQIEVVYAGDKVEQVGSCVSGRCSDPGDEDAACCDAACKGHERTAIMKSYACLYAMDATCGSNVRP